MLTLTIKSIASFLFYCFSFFKKESDVKKRKHEAFQEKKEMEEKIRKEAKKEEGGFRGGSRLALHSNLLTIHMR